jgi:hypothetical protein
MTKYEVYNDTTIIQFLVEQEAIDFATANNMLIRTIVVDEPLTVTEPSKQDWLNLEQAFYTNPNIFGKALQSTGNGFAFLAKVFADGKTIYASQNALVLAIGFLIPSMTYPYSVEELAFINQKLQENNFTITI